MGNSVITELMVREENALSPFACLNKNSQGRAKSETECTIRLPFQRDRDRIIHSKTFRRLTHKTQVFLTPTGDHYRTRLTHALEVAQIARTIANALQLNEHLAEAIALGHDLGHTPFGHAGEKALDELFDGGFRHNEQSLRVVDFIEKKGAGLNLTFEVRDGILKHSKGRKEIFPADLSELPITQEGQIVRISDIIAYVNHDLDDAMRAGIIKERDIPSEIYKHVTVSHSKRLGSMVLDLISNTVKVGGDRLTMSQEMRDHITNLRSFLYKNVYEISKVHADFEKANKILQELYQYFLNNDVPLGVPNKNQDWEKEVAYPANTSKERKVCDFVAGMTDRFALELYSTIFFPKPWGVH